MIEHIHEEYPEATMQARRDFAKVTKTPIVEKPYWFRDTDTKREYHGIYGAIGWPQKLSERGDELPGYGVIVGVLRDAGNKAEHAAFHVLEEAEHKAEDLLIQQCVQMRERWGYGVHKDILPFFFGDYRPFELTVAHFNTRLLEATGTDEHAFIVSPPDDFDQPNAFDIYMGRLRTVLSSEAKRLHLDNHEIIKNRILAFRRDDPAIMALGGLMHTLLIRSPWMEQTTPGIWQMPEEQ